MVVEEADPAREVALDGGHLVIDPGVAQEDRTVTHGVWLADGDGADRSVCGGWARGWPVAAAEAGRSRIFGGIHYEFSN
jgi:hypothetical protein